MQPIKRNHRRTFALIAAVAPLALSAAALAQAPATEWIVSTSGATALGSFTRANSNASAPAAGTITRGTLAVGTTFTLGASTYAPVSGVTTYAGAFNASVVEAGGPVSQGKTDGFLYYYRESGSIQGILDLADSGGLLVASGGTPRRPGDPAANLFLWGGGARFNSVATGYSAGTTPNVVSPTPNTTRTNGRNYQPNGLPETSPNGQSFVRIAWSDVRFEQGFAITGSRNPSATPTGAGYGLGQGSIAGTNFQALRNASAIVGGINPSTTRLRNESLAVVPFNLVANPGTGLARVTATDTKWLQAVGRLANGADFNSATREIGSGTRNQGNNNVGLDPSWGGGERDRRYAGTSSLSGALYVDNDGLPVTLNPGGEMVPTLNLAGGITQDFNENRPSSAARFSDKISGSSGIRPIVVYSRMGVGILSAGDSRDNTNGTALGTQRNTTAAPLRALAIDWEDGNGANQATAQNVITGKYRMWSAAQAVTVAPYANPEANDALAANTYRPIFGDTNDQNIGGATSNAQPGVHRKFLDNINKSVATFTAVGSERTPADFVTGSAFIPPQIMAVTKVYDGGVQSPRTRSTVDPDGAGPQVSEDQLYSNAATGSGVLVTQTAWGDPSDTFGGLSTLTTFYGIWAAGNQGSSNAASSANRRINISDRTVLAGDFNGDAVRDRLDVRAMALALASPSTYLATGTTGTWNYNGSAVAVAVADSATFSSYGVNAAPADGLIVLSDFNTDGNITVDNTNSGSTQAIVTTPIEREDVGFFLFGAAVDTGTGTAQQRRETGVRTGVLRKNAAIDEFNAELDTFVARVIDPATGVNFTQTGVNKLKFSKFDVNGSGSRDFAGLVPAVDGNDYNFLVDAFAIDGFAGKSYARFEDAATAYLPQPFRLVNGTVIFVDAPFNLVRAKLADAASNSVADTTISQADMNVMNAGGLTGRVDHAWSGTTTKTGSLSIVLAPSSGTFTAAPGSALMIAAGSLQGGGAVDTLLNMPVTNNAGFGAAAGTATQNVATLQGTGTTTVAAGGKLRVNNLSSAAGFTSAIRQGSLIIGGDLTVAAKAAVTHKAGVVETAGISITSTGNLNLNDNDMIVKGADLASLTANVAALRTAARNWLANTAGAKLSSTAVYSGQTAGLTGLTTLAVFPNNLGPAGTAYYSSYDGVALTANDVIVKYTFHGDTNLDGLLDTNDLINLLEGFSTGGTGWQNGDINYDGAVTVADIALFNSTRAAIGGASLGNGTGDSLPGGGVIPEPAALGLLAGVLPLVSRRRRTR